MNNDDCDPASHFLLSERFQEAMVYAFQLHSEQKRKGRDVPYTAHLLGVTALVLEEGGDEDQAIAALLHDAVEDQGGLPVLEEIRQRFGERVGRIVDGLTDAYGHPKPPWRQRKERYLARLETESTEIWLVSLADKLYNAYTIQMDLQRMGDKIWECFNGGKDGTLWYYRSLVELFRSHTSGYMVDELARVVAEIERIAEEAHR